MRGPRVRLLAAGAVVCVAVLASACGGPATPGVANLSGHPSDTSGTSGSGTSGSGSTQQDAVKFAKCMRSHGVKNYPEPKAGTTGGVRIGAGSGINPTSPTFQAAQRACQSFLPKPTPARVKAAEQNALKFSKCMRSHGVTNFPDPQFSGSGGNISIRIGGAGLDPNSPTFQHAQAECGKYMHLPKGAKPGPGKQSSGAVAVP